MMLTRNVTKYVIKQSAAKTVMVTKQPSSVMTSIRFFSMTENNDKNSNKKAKATNIPTEYYHEETENERQLLEVISTLQNEKDFKSLSNIKKVVTWEDIHASREAPLQTMPDPLSMSDPEDDEVTKSFDLDDLKQLDEMDDEVEEAMIRRKGWQDQDDLLLQQLVTPEIAGSLGLGLQTGSNAAMNDFPRPSSMTAMNFTAAGLSEESPERFTPNPDFPDRPSKKGPCPGKLQRKGVTGILRCSKIDLDALHHLDVMTLRAYLTSDAEIMKRKNTGLCAKCQRQVAKTIKQARNMGILPHIGNFDIHEYPVEDVSREETHTSVRVDRSYFQSHVYKR